MQIFLKSIPNLFFGRIRFLLIRKISKDKSKPLKETYRDFLFLVKENGESDGNITMEKNTNNLGIITISNPKKRNAITGRMMYQLADIVDNLSSNQNSDLTCLVIRGVGDDAFCSGASFDLVKNVVNNPLKGKMMAEFMTDCLNRIRQSGLISICYINGPALGGGAELTTVADFRIINSKARIQFVHAKLGASPGWGGIHRLVSIIGRKDSIRLLCGSHVVNANESLDIGLVDKIIDSDLSNNDNYINICKDFLNIYLNQKYKLSVKMIKETIAEVDNIESKDSKFIEIETFKNRWFSDDNINALKDK